MCDKGFINKLHHPAAYISVGVSTMIIGLTFCVVLEDVGSKIGGKYVRHNGYIFIDGLKSYNSGFNKAKKLIKKYNWSLTVIDKEDKQNIDQNNMCWIKVNSNV